MSVLARILVVGGGSAGWITATYLDAALNGLGPNRRPVIEISLVEGSQVEQTVAEEATVPSIRETLRTVGLREAEVMRRTQATFMHGILYRDWNGAGHEFFHPFDRHHSPGPLDRSGADWMLSDGSVPFADLVSSQPRLARSGYAPKLDFTNEYLGPMDYAYQLDAEALVALFRQTGLSRGVSAFAGDVGQVVLQCDTGCVDHVILKNGRVIKADLFVDCSGFAAVLIGEALQIGFQDDRDLLPCDSAVVMHSRFAVGMAAHPYTSVTAMPAGWRWSSGLRNSRVAGYVYSSSFCSDEAAEAELRSAVKDEVQPARLLRFPVGRRDRAWAGNVVAIGSSAAFIEPLESTGLFLIERAARLLAEYFPFCGAGNASPLRDRFNLVFEQEYMAIRDLVVLHYVLALRADTDFWKEARTPSRRPDSLTRLLDIWTHKPPSRSDIEMDSAHFGIRNFEYVLYGLDWRNMSARPGSAGKTPLRNPEVEAKAAQMMRELPHHLSFLGGNFENGYL